MRACSPRSNTRRQEPVKGRTSKSSGGSGGGSGSVGDDIGILQDGCQPIAQLVEQGVQFVVAHRPAHDVVHPTAQGVEFGVVRPGSGREGQDAPGGVQTAERAVLPWFVQQAAAAAEQVGGEQEELLADLSDLRFPSAHG